MKKQKNIIALAAMVLYTHKQFRSKQTHLNVTLHDITIRICLKHLKPLDNSDIRT